jgi:hypothetical protein
VSLRALAGAHWRTALGAALGAGGGAAYAHFIGCHTGTCALTGNAWVAALFFGFTGAVMASPGGRRRQDRPPDAPGADARPT